MRTTLSRKALERRRLRGMTLLGQGRSQSEVAAMLGVTHTAVSQWRRAYAQGGAKALKARPHTGAPPKLNAGQLAQLQRWLLQGPRKHGYKNDLWTLSRLVAVIEQRFGVKYDQSGVWHVMKRLGWSCQKPQRRARERDENAIATWRKKDWPRIKKS